MQQVIEDKKVTSEDIIDLTRYVNLLKRNWLSIFVFSILITGLSILIILSITPKYTATATLLIESKEKKAISIQDVIGIDPNNKEYYQTQVEILKSNQIANRVIDSLNLDKLPEFNGSLVKKSSFINDMKESSLYKSLFYIEDKNNGLSTKDLERIIRQGVLYNFSKNLKIAPVKNTQLVEISFTSADPKLAAKVANEVGYAYIESSLDARLSATRYASSWISGRLGQLRTQLQKSEQVLSDFLVKEKLIDDSGIDALASQELANLTKRLAQVRDERIATESAYSALTSGKVTDIASISAIPAISRHPQVVAIREAQIDAENEVRELSKRYGPKHDKMIAAEAKLKSIQDQAKATTKKLIKGIGKELQAQRKQENLLISELKRKKNEYQLLTVKKSRYDSLKREVETNRNILNVFLTREKETSATSDFDSINARFTDEALIPQVPSKPKRKIIIAGAFVSSVIFAIFILFLVDTLKRTIESEKDFEDRFGLIPMSGIPQVTSKRYRKNPLDSNILFDDSQIGFCESIRTIRTSIILNDINRDKKIIAVTSSLPSEGKTTIAINVAMSFSKLEKILLIDCDFRKSSVSSRFGYKKHQQGLTNYLLMDTPIDECILKDSKSGLDILFAGMLCSNPQELLSSGKFESVLKVLKNSYDRIIVDTPPVIPISDTLIIGKLTDSIIIVVKANETKQDVLEKTITKLVNHELVIEGFVMNQVSNKVIKSEYGYSNYNSYSENKL